MGTRQVNFTLTADESVAINKITDRAVQCYKDAGGYVPDRQTLQMDITAVHKNGCPLRLDDLLQADDFNFGHDIGGIHDKIDRETGELTDHFLPRFAAKS